MVGIVSFGGYVPRRRLQRASVVQANAWLNPGLKGLGKGERAICNWDEDAVTMGVEAARDCLAGRSRAEVAAVFLASTSLPFQDRQHAGILKEALDLSDTARTLDVGFSQRAGTSALIEACHAATGGGGPVLCVASEKRPAKPGSEGEMLWGDGAAALLIGSEEPLARFVGASSTPVDFLDHYRGEGQDFDYVWEPRWLRDEGYGRIVPGAIAQALAKLGWAAADIDHFVLATTLSGVPQSVAKKCGIAPTAVRDPLTAVMGEAGAAHALVMLVHTLQSAAPGQKILVAGFGQGCDVIAFETTGALASIAPRDGIVGSLARRKAEDNYVRYLFFNGLIELDKGMRGEVDRKVASTVLYRNRRTVMALIGGRCPSTGAVQFPKSDIPLEGGGENAVLEDYPLADRPARVLTHTADTLTFTPDPPAYYGMVEFEGGGRMLADFTDVDADQVSVGAPMRMVFRIKHVDEARGFTQYFWKATPVSTPASTSQEPRQ